MSQLCFPKRPRLENQIDFNLCIVCQNADDEKLLSNRTTLQNLISKLKVRASYNELKYEVVFNRLNQHPEHFLLDNGRYHRSCQQNVTHKGHIERARAAFENQTVFSSDLGQDSAVEMRSTTPPVISNSSLQPADVSQPSNIGNSHVFRRSQAVPFDKELCFFCDGKSTWNEKLRRVETESASVKLRDAVEKKGDERLRVRLCTSIDVKDAIAIDVRYHTSCWLKNVCRILEPPRRSLIPDSQQVCEISSRIEFGSLLQTVLEEENRVITVASLHATYNNIRKDNGIVDNEVTRKHVRNLIEEYVPNVKFTPSQNKRESDRVCVEQTTNLAIDQLFDKQEQLHDEMNELFGAAKQLRKLFQKAESWEFTGTLNVDDEPGRHIPNEVYTFFRWLIEGPESNVTNEIKEPKIHTFAMSLSQTAMFSYLSKRQVQHVGTLRHQHEYPQQVGIGLAVHQAFRSKKAIDLLSGFGLSVNYDRVLRLETQLANEILLRAKINDGLYVPAGIIKGRHVFFSVDNCDFAEDTCDGKNTLHGTAIAIFQRRFGDVEEAMTLSPESSNRTLIEHDSLYDVIDCFAPSQKPIVSHPGFNTANQPALVNQWKEQDQGYLTARAIQADRQLMRDAEHGYSIQHSSIPVWSAFNSLIAEQMPLTVVRSPPIFPFPAHEWTTLLTILKYTERVNASVVDDKRRTVINMDLALLKPAFQLQLTRQDCKQWLLRPGDLHTVMAMVRTIGDFIEESGIDSSWIDAGLYGPVTTRKILQGTHIIRSIEAHLVTIEALCSLYIGDVLKDHSAIGGHLTKASELLNDACATGKREKVGKALDDFINQCRAHSLDTAVKQHQEAQQNRPLFIFLQHYISMVQDMMLFIRAVKTGDWELHLEAIHGFMKYFFAHDKLNYSRVLPLYLAQMKDLPKTDPEIYAEFQKGNWVVNKSFETFNAIGADHALEHINRWMKVAGGLIGITQNDACRTRFMLISPELARLADEMYSIAGVSKIARSEHHDLSSSVQKRHDKNVAMLRKVLCRNGNPFSSEFDDLGKLVNIYSFEIMPPEVTNDISTRNTRGQQAYEMFVKERIINGTLSIWDTMKKLQLKMWKHSAKTRKVGLKDKVLQLREDRSLFARLLMISRSRPDIDLKKYIGMYEFSVIPRSLFTSTGSLIFCSAKSALMHILEKLPGNQSLFEPTKCTGLVIAIIDGMAEVQMLKKLPSIRTCKDLASSLNEMIFKKYRQHNEIHVIFDRYDTELSVKSMTREKRQRGTSCPSFVVNGDTQIANVTLKDLLSNVKTKDQLTAYFAQEMLEYSKDSKQIVVVAWRNHVASNQTTINFSHLASEQEEADTKLILHAAEAKSRNPSELHIYSPDTDVFIIAISKLNQLPVNVFFDTGNRGTRRNIALRPIYDYLGDQKAAALIGLHAISGCDSSGSIFGKGKLSFWKAFLAFPDVIPILAEMGRVDKLTDDMVNLLEAFICHVYLPNTNITTAAGMRWWMFRSRQAEAEKLPPTRAALEKSFCRAHLQTIVWEQACIVNPVIPSPCDFGWEMIDGKLSPVIGTTEPAPSVILELTRCNCIKSQCSGNTCKCRSKNLPCTELCGCFEHECANEPIRNLEEGESDSEDA